MITSIRLQNFKAHRDTTVPLGRFTVLVGPNGAGKTSVLEALMGLERIVRSGPDPLFYGHRRLPISGIHNSAHLGPVALAVTGHTPEGPWELSVKLVAGSDPPSHYWTTVTASRGGSTSDKLEFIRAAFGEIVFHQLNAQRIAEPAPPSEGIPRVTEDGGNTAAVLASLKLADDERFARIEAELRKVVPTVERIRLRRVPQAQGIFDSISLDFRGAPNLSAYLASEGTLITLALLTSVCTSQSSTLFLLDDLDKSLHPVAQMELVRQLKRLLDELPDVQIVATTHSSSILDELDASDVQVFALREDGSVATKRLSEHPEASHMKGSLSPGQIWTLDPEERWVVAGNA